MQGISEFLAVGDASDVDGDGIIMTGEIRKSNTPRRGVIR